MKLLISDNAIQVIDGCESGRIEKELKERPEFYINQELKMLAVFLDEDTYNTIQKIFDKYKDKKDLDFGILEIVSIWKVIKPMLEKFTFENGETKNG